MSWVQWLALGLGSWLTLSVAVGVVCGKALAKSAARARVVAAERSVAARSLPVPRLSGAAPSVAASLPARPRVPAR